MWFFSGGGDWTVLNLHFIFEPTKYRWRVTWNLRGTISESKTSWVWCRRWNMETFAPTKRSRRAHTTISIAQWASWGRPNLPIGWFFWTGGFVFVCMANITKLCERSRRAHTTFSMAQWAIEGRLCLQVLVVVVVNLANMGWLPSVGSWKLQFCRISSVR